MLSPAIEPEQSITIRKLMGDNCSLKPGNVATMGAYAMQPASVLAI
jgi:hypothetical protein